jgi:pilus assembly protein CpaB
MSMRQVIVLVIAAIAAVGALLLIRAMNSSEPAPAETPAAAIVGEEILVAARDIAQGAALTPGDLKVAAFPSEVVSEHFIRIAGRPSAQTELVGAVTRRPFVQGEPIIADMVVQPDGRGFMAAMLAPGYRAVAVEIENSNAAGGYIQPNDHVDVILTQKIDGAEGGGDQVRSEIVLADVRVIAIGDKTQPQTTGSAPEQIQAGVAVLELTAEGARALGQAKELGDIALALRAVQVDTVGLTNNQTRPASQSSGAVIVHAFGSVSGGSR